LHPLSKTKTFFEESEKKEKRKKSERKVVREKKWCTFAPALRKAFEQWFRCRG